MTVVDALILSIVEGLSEFLPISSTGHLVLASKLLGVTQTEFVKSFEIFIQLGAILAVVVLYRQKFLSGLKIWKSLIAAFLPTAILGLIFYKIIKNYLLGNVPITLAALFLGGLILIFLNKLFPREKQQTVGTLTYKQAIVIGLFQSISMVPGVSRAAATIIGGRQQGLSKTEAVEFSFLLAVPTMLAATGLDLVKSNFSFSANEYQLMAIGFSGAFVTALIAIRFFINFIKNHDFKLFGYYRILLAMVFYLLIH